MSKYNDSIAYPARYDGTLGAWALERAALANPLPEDEQAAKGECDAA